MQQQAKQFIDLLESQQLLSPDVLDELRRQVAESKTRLTAELLAKLLVDNGHLTKFQATKLITELKDASATTKGTSTPPTNDDDDLGFADDAGLGTNDKSSDKSNRQKANIIVDDDELDLGDDDENVVDVVEVVEDDVVEVVEAEPVEAVEVVEAVEIAPRKAKRTVVQQDAFAAAPAPIKRVMPAKKSKANPYDSFRILGVGLLLALVLIAGFFLVNYFWRGSAEDRLKLADEAYEQRSYETAAVMYQDFTSDFPSNEKASYAKVRSALAAVRKTAEGAPDPKLGLEAALAVLPTVAGESAMAEQQSDLAGALIGLAGKFTERADRTTETAQRKLLMADMEKLLLLINDPQYVGTNQRNQQAPTLNRILEDRQRILREINRDEDLAKVLGQIDEKLTAQDTLGAYELRKALIKTYPLLEVNESLSDRIRKASVIERSLVKPASLNVSLSQQPPNEVIGRSFILAERSGKTASTLDGQVLFIKAKGSVYGIDGASGDILWRQFVGRSFHSEPLRLSNTSSADAIICLPEQGQLARLAGNSGAPLWWAGLGTTIHNPVAESDDLFVATFNGQVASLDAAGGQLKWATQLPQPAAVSPGVAFGKSSLYVPADHSNLFVLSRADGKCQEVFYLGHRAGSIAVPPVMLLGQLFVFENVTSQSSKIRILATSDQGLELKDAQAPIAMEGNIVVAPQIDGRRLIVQTDLGQTKVLDIEPTAETQKVSDLISVPKTVFTPEQSWLVSDNNRVWVVDNQLTRFDVQLASMNMNIVWSMNDGDRFDGPPQLFGNVLVHKRVLRGNQGMRVSAVEADSGKPIWETDLGMPVTHITSADSGYIALNTNGMVFALDKQPIKTEADSNPAQGKAATLFTDPVLLSDRRVVMLNRARGNELAIYSPTTKKMSVLTVNFGTAKPASQLVPVEDKVVLGLDSGQLVMLNLNNGAMAGSPYQPAMEANKTVQWNAPLYLAESKTLIVASDLQKLVRLSVSPELRSLNEVTLEHPLVGPIAAVGTQICAVESTRGGDVAQFFDQTSLNRATSLQLPGRRVAGPYSVPLASPSSCLLQTDSKLVMLTAEGKIAWAIDFPKSIMLGPPIVAGDNLIVITGAGGVWNIAAANGQVVGNLDAGQAFSSLPLVVSNNLLIGSDEGAVLALPIPSQPMEPRQ